MVNGADAEKGLYPWMAYIHRGSRLVCGGTLINHWFVLTAAHCLSEPNGLTVSLGVHNRNELDPSRLYQVDGFFKHWSYIGFDKDIALLKLARKAKFSVTIRPICILTDSKLKVNRLPWFLAIGWGRTIPDGNTSLILQTKILERRDISECDCLDTQICTVAESGTVCFGDSGGPVVREMTFKKKSRFVQLRVGSHVTDYCRKHAVFTEVFSHTMWIQFIVGWQTPKDD